MAQLDTRIPLAVQSADVGGSLLTGAKLAEVLMNRGEQMTPYQRESLALQRARLAQTGQMTPYQQRSLALREQSLAKPKNVSAVEAIRQKLVSGQPLSPGEQKVYDDATNMSLFDRILLGAGQSAPLGAPVLKGAPAGQNAKSLPAQSGLQTEIPLAAGGPLSFESDPQRRQVGQTYNLPDGRKARWQRDDQGNTGWELLN